VLVLVLVYGVLVPVYGGENAALDTPTRRRLPVRVHPCLCDDKPGYKYAGSSQADDFGGGTRLVGLLLLHGTRGRGRGSPLLVEQAKQACTMTHRHPLVSQATAFVARAAFLLAHEAPGLPPDMLACLRLASRQTRSSFVAPLTVLTKHGLFVWERTNRQSALSTRISRP